MNDKHLYLTSLVISESYRTHGIQQKINGLVSHLTTLLNNPTPTSENSFSDTLNTLDESLAQVDANLNFSYLQSALEYFDFIDLFGKNLSDFVHSAVSGMNISKKNAIDKLTPIQQKLHKKLGAFNFITRGIKELDLDFKDITFGQNQFIVSIPVSDQTNSLESLIAEFEEIKHFTSVFQELTRCPTPPKVSAIESNDFGIYLVQGAQIVAFTIAAIYQLYCIIEKFEVQRKTLEDAKKQNWPSESITPMEEHLNNLIRTCVHDAAVEIIKNNKVILKDTERINELTNKLAIYLKKMIDKVSLGYKYDIRYIPFNNDEDKKVVGWPTEAIIKRLNLINKLRLDIERIKIQASQKQIDLKKDDDS